MSFTTEEAWIDAHLDLLQNIEAMIAGLYRSEPEFEDWDVFEALSALIQKYKAQVRGRTFTKPRLTERADRLFGMISGCLATREDLDTCDDQLRALKEVRSSVRRHTEMHGKRGYLDFIIEFA
jgi:hypothetical protein